MDGLFLSCLNLSGSTCRMLVVMFLLHVISDKKVNAQNGKVGCDVPSVEALNETVLTCRFPEDVSETKRDVSVYLYKDNESPDAIVDCWWLGGRLECYGAPGYSYTTKISDVFTVTITRASANQTGTYSCQLAGYGASQLSTCDFSIKSGPKTLCDVPNVTLGSSTSLSCYFSEEVSKTHKDFTIYHFPTQGRNEAVLTCKWNQGSLTCNTSPGYQFDRRVTNTLSVKLPRVSSNHSGTFSCQLAGAQPGAYENCTFGHHQGKACIADVESTEPATITCIFNVNVNKTRTNFTVIHYSDQDAAGTDVLRCHWLHNNLVCDTEPCYDYSPTVTAQLTVKILRTKLEHGDRFIYRLQTSANSLGPCQIMIDSENDNNMPVILGVIFAVFILAFLVLLLLYYIKRQRRPLCGKKRKSTSGEEELLMIPVQVADPTTEKLQATLSDRVKDNYPDIFSKFYFVPSLYLNRNIYRNAEVGGEHVVVMEPAQEEIMRHDQSIQHVLKCLRQLAERDSDVMFVLSQFSYDDYLACVGEEFSDHTLPVPSKLRKDNHQYGDFDVLIVHRQHGLVVVVVKASGCRSDIGVDVRDNGELVKDMGSAIKQLNGAEKMLQHLISDQHPRPSIRKTLMLPNLSLQSLRETLKQHPSLATGLRDCVGLTNSFDVPGECLCADQLSADNVLDQLKVWLRHHTTGSEVDSTISDNQYVTILSRFCGPATRPSFTMPGGNRLTLTPTTLQHAVYLTGELFNGTIIHPEHYDVLTKASPRVFLFGPPGTGKTTSLVLIGKRWLSEGHRVCVISTWRESRTSSRILYETLKLFTEKGEKWDSSKDGRVIFEDLNLEKQEMKKAVKKILSLSTTDGLLVLADDAGPYLSQVSSFKTFCNMLLAKHTDLHLWAASRLGQETHSSDWEEVHFRGSVSCPPTLLQEKDLMKLAEKVDRLIKWDPDVIGVAPTEGLPIKYIYHREGHSTGCGKVLTCRQCCLDVIAFLESLGISAAASDPSVTSGTVSKSNSTNPDAVPARTSTPRLYMSDVLFLFEFEHFEKTTFCKTLKEFGINAKVVKEKDSPPCVHEHNDQHVWLANAEQVRGLKRKVVVYVEEQVWQTNVSIDWIRVNSVTSCTSQLIWVQDRRSLRSS